jgi:phosphatidylserine/phosphatidylglycerophosphate/cardiolipin synthase-like enzyme
MISNSAVSLNITFKYDAACNWNKGVRNPNNRVLRPLFLILACLILVAGCNPLPLPPLEVYFSPDGGCAEAIVAEISTAKSTILVQAYSFTSAPIAKALVNAHKRGVDVRVVLDKSQKSEKYSSADFLHHAGIPLLIDSAHAIAHNKIIIIDDREVITGSFNFTKSAEENNAENLLIIRDAAVADTYLSNWRLHAEHSAPYTGSEREEPE